jgi:hypothetical protein
MNSHLNNITLHILEADYPKAVKDAQAFKAAADTLAENIAQSQPVNIATATTPAEIPKVHAAAVAHDLEHALKIKHAADLVSIANDRHEAAWRAAVPTFEASFAARFDAAASDLYAEIKALGGNVDGETVESEPWNEKHNGLRDVFVTLSGLASIRDEYALLHGVNNSLVSNQYEQTSRTAHLASTAIEQELRYRAGQTQGINYWIIAAQMPGVQIKWQTAEQQNQQPAPQAVIARNAGVAALARTSA